MPKFLHLTTVFILPLLSYGVSGAANIKAPSAKAYQETTARGVLRAGQTAKITAAMTNQLLKADYKPGQYFKSGALLVKFDCSQQKAELEAKMQAHQTLLIKHENAAELFSLGAAGELDVTLARSEMQQAFAEATIIKAKLKDCDIYAPYDGYITARHVSAFETPQAGQLLYSIQRAGSVELSIIAPSNWMRWITKGQSFTFTVDETGEAFKANIIRTGAAVDPVSQTIEITAKPARNPKALVGMSGLARFETP